MSPQPVRAEPVEALPHVRFAVCAAALLALAGCDEQIHHGLDEKSANDLQTVLIERGIAAEKVPEAGKKPTWAIRVPGEDADEAIRVLSALGLPKRAPSGFEDLSTGLVPSPMEERVRWIQALSGELERTLESAEGVLSARVHLVIPQPPRPGQPAAPSKASALIRARPGMADRVKRGSDGLRYLLAGSVEGLAPENVTLVVDEVLLEPVRPLPPGAVRATSPFRALAVGLGVLVSVLGLVVVGLVLRMRRLRDPIAPAKPNAITRPMPATGAPRKVA